MPFFDREGPFGLVLQLAPIGQAGQAVMTGQLGEPMFLQFEIDIGLFSRRTHRSDRVPVTAR